MQLKKPTKKQAMLITKNKLKYANWLVLSDTPEELIIISRSGKTQKNLRKEVS